MARKKKEDIPEEAVVIADETESAEIRENALPGGKTEDGGYPPPEGESALDADSISGETQMDEGSAENLGDDVIPDEDEERNVGDDSPATEALTEAPSITLLPNDPPGEATVDDEDMAHNDSGISSSLPESIPEAPPKPSRSRKKTILNVDLRDLDRQLSDDQRQEWEAIYASYRAKSVLTGTVLGIDQTSFEVFNPETGENERKRMSSLIIIDYRVKVLIPEAELWYPGEERPDFVMRNMVGSVMDYVIIEVDRKGEIAIASRRMALNSRRRFFAKQLHREGDLLRCKVMSVGAKRCTVECFGFDIPLSQRDLSYAAIPDLRRKYHPGQELSCRFKGIDLKTGRPIISVKEVNPNPFEGADRRHPVGSRRHAVISGKYAGGVFCTLPDDTVCLCLYSPQHHDADFRNGDSVILLIKKYDYGRQLIYGQILAKW